MSGFRTTSMAAGTTGQGVERQPLRAGLDLSQRQEGNSVAVDELAIWSRALRRDEITALCNNVCGVELPTR